MEVEVVKMEVCFLKNGSLLFNLYILQSLSCLEKKIIQAV